MFVFDFASVTCLFHPVATGVKSKGIAIYVVKRYKLADVVLLPMSLYVRYTCGHQKNQSLLISPRCGVIYLKTPISRMV